MRDKDIMTGLERIGRILKHQSVDRIGCYEHFWTDTAKTWTDQGYLKEGEDIVEHFDFDMDLCWAFNMTADIDFVPQTIREDEDTITIRDGNGALLRRHKKHDSTPEHVGFLVTDRESWDQQIKPLLSFDERRINFTAYREAKERCRRAGRFFCLSGMNVFELMHPVCGHENLLIGMALDPGWVEDMVRAYSDLIISLQEALFDAEGSPDAVWYYEDLGFKERPFMSPAMYKELIQPGHTGTIRYAKGRKLPVIMHSCGFVEPLIPYFVEAGIDCLQVIEVKAGMDLLRIHRNYGDQLALMGGIDVRTLYSNDTGIIDTELYSKIPLVKEGFGYILHSDHSIPDTVNYESYCHFLEQGLKLGHY